MFPASFAPTILKLIAPKLQEKISSHLMKVFKLEKVLEYVEMPNELDKKVEKLEAQVEMLKEMIKDGK
tara:strand:+ start:1905 stop:2108 length:204 start_codon:yes stop_codon:yes gene_type:complete